MNLDDSANTEEHQTARNIVLRQLAAAPKTRHQLAEKLHESEVSDNVIEHVLDRFEEVELIDDAGFAEAWVRASHRSQGLARRARSTELRQHVSQDQHAKPARKE